jgi:hypothetical protein
MFVVLPRRALSHDELFAHVGLLNSAFMTWYFRTIVPRVGRAFAELKIQHLAQFPLPEAGGWRAAVEPLAAASRILHNQPSGERAHAAQVEIDRLVAGLYPLPAWLANEVSSS